jgi:hypothetical protein
VISIARETSNVAAKASTAKAQHQLRPRLRRDRGPDHTRSRLPRDVRRSHKARLFIRLGRCPSRAEAAWPTVWQTRQPGINMAKGAHDVDRCVSSADEGHSCGSMLTRRGIDLRSPAQTARHIQQNAAQTVLILDRNSAQITFPPVAVHSSCSCEPLPIPMGDAT